MAVNRISGNLHPFLTLGPQHSFLDIGCGSGRHLKSIQVATGCSAEGIDFDIRDELIEKFRAAPLRLHRGEFFSYDFGDRKFDVIYAAHIIEHLADPVGFLQRIEQMLKPGGVCVLETPNIDCVGARLFGPHWGGNHVPRHWFLPTPKSAEKLVLRAAPESLRLMKIKFIPITFLIWSLHSLLTTHVSRRFADWAFPSDHRYVATAPVNLFRHGVAYLASAFEK